ncbi:A disintegrin and metalloproteinase with thrombospondin motifs 20 [Perognathus longimembris pacificus]|uniref:A disintegrin and metalloproteinase with thrombospondin motifs 20 n=1 Tax=Perognathus longimembris pacificus TaxID=214514 RepID=UPI002019646F|nr:A disintegrin and metalloproteinase with thrombospondin motifs 20 [Perognathus longimembris pacificus]
MRVAKWITGLLYQLSLIITRSWEVHFHPRQEALVKTLESYEVVTPVRVNAFGEVFPQSRHFSRKKRSSEDPEPTPFRTHYRISAYGQLFRLNLSADATFLAPGYREVHVGTSARGTQGNRTVTTPDLRHCFYRGQVNAREDHRAVFSLCGGLIGTFKTHDGEYFLEPIMEVNGTEHQEDHNKPHLIYRKEFKGSSLLPSYRPCEVSDDQIKNITLPFHDHNYMSEDLSQMKERVFKISSENMALGAERRQLHSRNKRFISYPRYVEVMVTADAKMAHFHGKNLQHYVLTLMSVVAAIYKDSSIGNLIEIVVVKLVVLHNEQEGPVINSNAPETLRNFCAWQQTQNVPDDANPTHHDTAVLITREDICGAKGRCDTLGLAELGTMCDPLRSCSISEENGLSAAFTIAHELGHVFNMPHDDSFKCKEAGVKDQYHVMAPSLNYNTSPWTWSTCSQKYITEFLDIGQGECLLDKPSEHVYPLPSQLPGLLHDANRQCELMYGPGSQVCPYLKQCRRLWCTSAEGVHKGCRTHHMPLADGTDCGPGMHCYHGQCVNRDMELRAVDGEWGPWGPYSSCSRTCGGGVKSSTRLCDSPEPRNGGKYCVGRRMKFRSCSTDPCPQGKEDFREKQCSEFNGKHFNFNGLTPDVRWLPKLSGIAPKDRCKLYCRVAGTPRFYQLKDKVVDGTPCGTGTNDICVQGLCQPAGCDHVLNSKVKRDKCGVCGGDDSSCRTLTGVFNSTVRYGYNVVVKIPIGATNIEILQYSHSGIPEDDNYLALSDTQGNFLLNGNFVVSMSKKEINIQGAIFQYSGSNHSLERINSTDRLEEELVVQVLCVGDLYNPNVHYSFNIPVEEKSDSFAWDPQGPWEDCSKMCQGLRRRKVVCIRQSDGVVVSDERCDHLQLPATVTEGCNTDCELRWHIVGRSECSSACGPGSRSLDVRCMRYSIHKGQAAPMDAQHCSDQPKPALREPCHGHCSVIRWHYSEWSQCSRSCGGGQRTRDSYCENNFGRRLAEKECQLLQRVTVERCNEISCPSWATSEWSECTATCGHGYQVRAVKCVGGPFSTALDDGECPATSRPRDKQDCTLPSCPVLPEAAATFLPGNLLRKGSQWRYGSWTACSVSCGRGTRARYVSCRDVQDEIAEESSCAHLPRPAEVAECFRLCGEWRAGAWSPCSASCGQGKTTRQVACVSSHQAIDERYCDPETRPAAQEACSLAICPHTQSHVQGRNPPLHHKPEVDKHPSPSSRGNQWRTGPWGSCSSSCEGGIQQRAVVCQDENGLSASYCDPASRPPEAQHCNTGPCPRWNYGSWGECTQTCGGGTKSRFVICQLPDGQMLPEHSCEPRNKPPSVAQCHTPACPQGAAWRRGPWKMCSASCGKGMKLREVFCMDPFQGKLEDRYCSHLQKPRTHKACRAVRCPSWKANRWKECSATCGAGVQRRDVFCRLRGAGRVAEEACEAAARPRTQRPCRRRACGRARWAAGPWLHCSPSCKKKETYRQVKCVDAKNTQVDEHLCDGFTRPFSAKRCRKPLCKYVVVTADSSQCAGNCGLSYPQRITYCVGIQSTKKHKPPQLWPVQYQECPVLPSSQLHKCDSRSCLRVATWKVGKWSQCSMTCGTGVMERRVECRLENGWPTDLCLKHLKPDAQKKCYAHDCKSLATCKEIQVTNNTTKDGDYYLNVKGRIIKVHCSGMTTESPMEYLPLVKSEDNFSEVYGLRLENPHECPFNGSRRQDCNCKNDYLAAGYTVFQKIRIDLTSMQIKTMDFLYSQTIFGKTVPYATAGDCYSAARCPQGQFSINLTGTGVKISSTAKWLAQGRYASIIIHRSQDGAKVYGRCGGFCGKCAPLVASSLPFQVL